MLPQHLVVELERPVLGHALVADALSRMDVGLRDTGPIVAWTDQEYVPVPSGHLLAWSGSPRSFEVLRVFAVDVASGRGHGLGGPTLVAHVVPLSSSLSVGDGPVLPGVGANLGMVVMAVVVAVLMTVCMGVVMPSADLLGRDDRGQHIPWVLVHDPAAVVTTAVYCHCVCVTLFGTAPNSGHRRRPSADDFSKRAYAISEHTHSSSFSSSRDDASTAAVAVAVAAAAATL